MINIYCTLYNSLYLDKGLVLYDSLCECAKDFKLYVLCMDDKCFNVLSDLKQPHHIPIRLADFEQDDEALQQAKQNRSFGEYCWTCTPSLIRYILRNYSESICTYIDADLLFYQDPSVLIDELVDNGKSVLIVPHRFTKVNKELEKNGLFCVEFNTFIDSKESLGVLEKWREDCLSCCTADNDGVHFGDQKYLDEWPFVYDCVHVCSNMGAGVAPWNIQRYRLYRAEKGCVSLMVKNDKSVIRLVFYHFHNIEYLNDKVVRINVFSKKYNVQYSLVKQLYGDYLSRIDEKKRYLRGAYNIDIKLKSHPAFTPRAEKRPLVDRLKRITINKLITKWMLFLNRKKDYFRL